MFLIYYLIAALFIRNHPSNTSYPEGDTLIDKWHKDDIAETEFDFSADGDEEYRGIPDTTEIEKAKYEFETDKDLSGKGFSVNTDLFDD